MGLTRNGASQQEIDDAGGDIGFPAIRGGFALKRNPSHHHHNHHRHRTSFDRQLPRMNNSSGNSGGGGSRSHLHNRLTRKGLLLWLFPFSKSKSGFYALIVAVVFLFALASMVMQSSITSVFRQGAERGKFFREGFQFRGALRFVPGRVSQRFLAGDGLDQVRSQPRIGIRAPRIALIRRISDQICASEVTTQDITEYPRPE